MTLKVAICSTQKGWRGGEEQCRLLALGLRDQGHQVSIMCRRATPLASRMRQANVTVHSFKGRGWNPAAVISNRRFLARFRPDVIHLNDSHALTAISLAGLGMLSPLRVAARRVMFPIHSRLRYRYFCDALICISDAVAQVARTAGIDDQQLRVVHDGVDPRRMDSGSRERGRAILGLNDEPLLLYIAALAAEKGHETLLRAIRQVVAEVPNLKLALAGDGPQRESLELQVKQMNLTGCVQLLGHREDIADLLHACDLFVFPSTNEGLGSSLIDAMLVSRPIVCSRSGGVPELFQAKNQSNPLARLVATGDDQALAEAILLDLSDRESAQARAARARRHALDHFSADAMVANTLAVYQESLQAKRPRQAA